MKLFSDLDRSTYVLLSSVTFLLFLGTWTLLSATVPGGEVFLPSPFAVVGDTAVLFREQNFSADIAASIYRVSAGFMLAVVVAVPLGVLAGALRWVDALVQPFNDFVRYMPVAALIPLTILWTGIGDLQKITIIFLGTVFQLIPMTSDTVARVPRHLVDLGYTLGLSPWGVLRKVVVPWCIPMVYDHCRVALGWAWSYLVVAELVAATSGIGHVIIQSQRFIRTGEVIGAILAIGVIGLLFDVLFKASKRRLFPWA